MSLFTFNINHVSDEETKKTLVKILKNQKKIMASLDEIQAEALKVQETLDNVQATVASSFEALNATIADLQAQLADGGTPEQRQAVLDSLVAITADLGTTIPA